MLADESMGDSSPTLASLRALNDGWANVSDKAKQRQRQLEAALKEASAFQNEVGGNLQAVQLFDFICHSYYFIYCSLSSFITNIKFQKVSTSISHFH